jgi:hypothetical protein
MALKQVDMVCALCKGKGIAKIDTTENVVLMVCVCPACADAVNEVDAAAEREPDHDMNDLD